jgi:hypothetical protein
MDNLLRFWLPRSRNTVEKPLAFRRCRSYFPTYLQDEDLTLGMLNEYQHPAQESEPKVLF